MKITYGINQPHSPSNPRLRHENHSLTITGDWDDPQLHKQIRARIGKHHPGWSITGYAPAPRTYTFIITLPHDSIYPLSSSMLTTLIADDSMSLTHTDITITEVLS